MKLVYCTIVQYQVFLQTFFISYKNKTHDTFYLLILNNFLTVNNFFEITLKKLLRHITKGNSNFIFSKAIYFCTMTRHN